MMDGFAYFHAFVSKNAVSRYISFAYYVRFTVLTLYSLPFLFPKAPITLDSASSILSLSTYASLYSTTVLVGTIVAMLQNFGSEA